MELEVSDEELNHWEFLEDQGKEIAEFPWNSKIRDGRLRVKIDDRTMFFDSNSDLVKNGPKPGSIVSCIIEFKHYNYKEMSGLSARAYQVKIYDSGWMGV